MRHECGTGNFSHGDHESHGRTIDHFRKVRDKLGIAAAVMLDTKGPEIRTGDFEGGKIIVEPGQRFTLTTEKVMGKSGKILHHVCRLPKEVKKGDFIPD